MRILWLATRARAWAVLVIAQAITIVAGASIGDLTTDYLFSTEQTSYRVHVAALAPAVLLAGHIDRIPAVSPGLARERSLRLIAVATSTTALLAGCVLPWDMTVSSDQRAFAFFVACGLYGAGLLFMEKFHEATLVVLGTAGLLTLMFGQSSPIAGFPLSDDYGFVAQSLPLLLCGAAAIVLALGAWRYISRV